MIAVVGNGTLPPNVASIINLSDEVYRINRAAFKENVKANAHVAGSKITTYVHNCWCETEPTFWMPKNTKIWLTIPLDANPFVQDKKNHTKIFQDAGFTDIYQFTYDDIAPLRETYKINHPTTGLIAVYKLIKQGKCPVLFGFSMEDDLRHYFDNEKFTNPYTHKPCQEREVLALWLKEGLIRKWE